jgi:hypothetical protein
MLMSKLTHMSYISSTSSNSFSVWNGRSCLSTRPHETKQGMETSFGSQDACVEEGQRRRRSSSSSARNSVLSFATFSFIAASCRSSPCLTCMGPRLHSWRGDLHVQCPRPRPMNRVGIGRGDADDVWLWMKSRG